MRIVPEIETRHVLGFYSKYFVVSKPEVGKYRVIINMKPINKYVEEKF